MRRTSRSLSLVLVFSQLSLGVGCHNKISGASGSGQGSLIAGILGTNDLGKAFFDLYRSKVAAEPDASVRTAKLAALDKRRSDFIQAVNDIINARSVGGGLRTAESLFGLVDDGTLPRLAEDAAQILELLKADPAAQNAIVELLKGATTAKSAKGQQLPLEDFIALLARLDNYPDVEKLWTAAADITTQNPQLANDLLAWGSRELKNVQPPSNLQASLVSRIITGMHEALLDPAQLRSGQSFGPSEWVVRLDARGVPKVAVDPATGTRVAPFVDGGNGLAALDAQDRFVDAAGAVISMPPFGKAGSAGFDGDGRALAAGGQLAFVYFDAKQTTLALELKLLGDLLRANVHERGMNVAEAALGPRKTDGSYDDGPVADVLHGGLELLATDDAPKVLRALGALLQNDPARAERLLVAFSRAIDKAKAAQQASAQAGGLASLSLSDPRIVQLTDDLLPLVDDVFTAPAVGGPSTARVLMDTLDDLSRTVPDWPARVAPLAVMHRIQPAVAVDHSKPATYVASNGATVDNRSSLHQLLDLLARADGCKVPFTSTSLAEMILSSMATLTPQTVSSLTSIITSIPGFLINIACPGLSNDIAALDDLAKSGSLDALLPIAKAFKDRNEIPLLVKILVRVQRSYGATLRDAEPDVNRILASGACEELCGLLGESTRINDPATGARLADILADSIATVVNQHSSQVSDRRGQRVPSLAYLLLLPLRQLDARLRAANVTGDLASLSDTCVSIVLARAVDPQTGQEVLANGCIVPFVTKVLQVASDVLPADPAQRRSLVSNAQSSATSFVLSKDMGSLMALERTLLNASSRPTIDAAIVNLLTPNANTKDDIFGAVVKLIAIELQTWVFTKSSLSSATTQAVVDLAHFAGDAIDPQRPVVQDVIVGITKILVSDSGKTVINLQRAAFNVSPTLGRAPAAVLIEIFQQVGEAGGSSSPITLAELQSGIDATIKSIRDPKGSVASFFDIIRNRKKKV